MINYEKVAEKIFAIIKGHGHTLSMYKEDGMDTTDAAEARRFFVQKPNYMVTLDDETDTIKINKNSNLSLDDLESLMKQMKNLARANMLNTQVKVFGKEITPKDFAYQAKKYRNKEMGGITEATYTTEGWRVHIPANIYDGKYYDFRTVPVVITKSLAPTEQDAIDYINSNKEAILAKLDKKRMTVGSRSIRYVGKPVEKNVFFKDSYHVRPVVLGHSADQLPNSAISEASLSRMSGSTKTSYQTLESVKMVVRHRKPVAEEVRGSRSRQISAIFLEQAGERFRFPHNCLPCARAMARHMYEGGTMRDTIGEYIVESSGNMLKLKEFIRYTRTNKLINEASEDIIATVKENIATISNEFKRLTGAKSYTKMSEAIAAREASVLEENDTDDLKDMFTVRKFDEKFGDTLPLVNRLMNEKTAWRNALIEASSQTVWMDAKEALAEIDIVEFDSPVQQIGYKIQKVANRMVETGELQSFVGRVAGKLIEGEVISEFEKTIVRNVMENAKAKEEDECIDEEKEDTLEGIANQYELKMKMIEHEDVFVESPGLHGYIAHFKGAKEEIHANSLYSARQQALAKFTPNKRDIGLLSVNLADTDGPCAAQFEDSLAEEPGDFDHGYNYEGMGNKDFDDNDREFTIGDKFTYVPGGFVVEVYDILRGGAYIELQDDDGQIITVTPQELKDEDYKPMDSGRWMDPAGGMHDADEEDPAAMYEGGKDSTESFTDECPECEGYGELGVGGDDKGLWKCTKCDGDGYI